MTTAKKIKKTARKGIALMATEEATKAYLRSRGRGNVVMRAAKEALDRSEKAEHGRDLKQLVGQRAEGSALRDSLTSSGVIEAVAPVVLTPGEMIREIRKLQDLTQGQLAERAGLSQPAIAALESGEQTLGLDRAKVLAAALSVHPAVLAFPGWKVG